MTGLAPEPAPKAAPFLDDAPVIRQPGGEAAEPADEQAPAKSLGKLTKSGDVSTMRITGRSPEAAALRAARVVAAVRELATEGGFEAVQMREVANRAGVTLSTLYRYYPSKDDLIRAAVVKQLELLRADVLARPPRHAKAGARAAAVFVRAFHAISRDRGYAHAAMSMFRAPRPLDADPLPINAQERTSFVDIAALAAWGSVHRTTEDEYTVLYVLESLLISSVIQWLDGAMSPEYVERRLMFTAERLIPDTDK